MPEMKYYIVYAYWKPENRGPENFKKAMENWSKKVEEASCKVVLWGAALGCLRMPSASSRDLPKTG